MIFSPKDKMRGLSKRVMLMNSDGESSFFKKCKDCTHDVCLLGIAADEHSKLNRSVYRSIPEDFFGKRRCFTAARNYFSGLSDDQFMYLMSIQEIDDIEAYEVAKLVKQFSETGVVLIERMEGL